MEINTPATIGPGEFFPVVGVGPHEKPWPTGDQYDPELLENGDRRNVLDHYRYWSVAAIVTDKYLTVIHHPTIADFAAWCKENNLPIIGIDNVPTSKRLEGAQLPESCVLLFGQEGAGMSDEGIEVCEVLYEIQQYGSTRSMNASAAGAIAMYHWALQHLPK